ncbi:amino acid ABC transporter substrate-binding protein [Thalassobaculum salexigens]|uniref:amino acid ABC transporter substrate-binding protein n=1 Tax=Thalassobaculum salexigens TaxID=455360 RepID=UPI00040CE2F0|nr:amino acid ABC transporter substrate-binding protein [Thalassobaculum salexigens]
MKKVSLLALGAGFLASLAITPEPVLAQDSTLEIVKNRGILRCQVGTPAPGFYSLSDDGKWSGFDVENCRAVSAAIFGDPDKIEYQSVTSAVRFTAMANGESDVLSRTTTWTLFRDTQLGLDFTTVNFYDGQGFMVTNDSGVTSALELAGATVCVLTGTTTELNLTDYSRTNSLDINPVVFEDSNVRDSTFFSGGCDAITNDKSSLASTRAKAPDQSIFTILPETISKEPLGPVVRQNDSQWNDIVMWSLFAMINAEEMGINSGNVDEMKASSTNPEIKRMLGVEGDLNKGLGLEPEWAYNIIKTVGNYAENYEEFMGPKTVMNIPRAGSVNDLWTKGGLMYSPPFR